MFLLLALTALDLLSINTAHAQPCDPMIAQAEERMRRSAGHILHTVTNVYQILKPWMWIFAIFGIIVVGAVHFFGISASTRIVHILLAAVLFDLLFAIVGTIFLDIPNIGTTSRHAASGGAAFTNEINRAFSANNPC